MLTKYFYIILIITLLLVLYFIIEFIRHNIFLNSIPIRIHVNGIRGKSSVTRLITAGLQAGGIKTLGKTTGSSAQMLLPDGVEVPIQRIGPPNIIEQLKIIKIASRMSVDAIVIECMAVKPDLQWLCEHKIVRSTAGVITNIRPDHLDEMGPTLEKVCDAISSTIPRNGLVFTAEEQNLVCLVKNAKEVDSKVITTDPEDVTDDEVSNFAYFEHKENVSLALDVVNHYGVKRDVALKGMYKANPDPGALKITRIKYFEKTLDFINAFAANDPVSTGKIWETVVREKNQDYPVIVIANARSDRISRTEQLAEMLAKQLKADYYIIVGGYTKVLDNMMIKYSIPGDRLFDYAGEPPSEVFEKVIELTPRYSKVFAVGNIGGIGHKIAHYFENRGVNT
ncbi:poly-gamma-glutamate synthase PgsB [bacterium]|nr:poly-gamma-glutamate synthase PgsB [bacterium]